jgi:hypothetical protein
MFPRGEVGAGVLVVSLSYGLSGPAITVAVLSLILNLLCSGLFIIIVKRLLVQAEPHTAPLKSYKQAAADHEGDLQHAAFNGNAFSSSLSHKLPRKAS